MKEIILVRHATAETWNAENDLTRKLVSKGLKESKNIGVLLAKLLKITKESGHYPDLTR